MPQAKGKGEFYVTSYCNFAHSMQTGRPIGHECYVIPVDALKLERGGSTFRANHILAKWALGNRQIVKGR